MSVDVMYRIGPVERPSEYQDLAQADMAAAFVAAHRRWPTEPLFCREWSCDAPPAGSHLGAQLPDWECIAPFMVLNLN
jgi:hypothetical protein